MSLQEIEETVKDVRHVSVNVWEDSISLRFYFEDGGTVDTMLDDYQLELLKENGVIEEGVDQ